MDEVPGVSQDAWRKDYPLRWALQLPTNFSGDGEVAKSNRDLELLDASSTLNRRVGPNEQGRTSADLRIVILLQNFAERKQEGDDVAQHAVSQVFRRCCCEEMMLSRNMALMYQTK